MKYWVRLDKQRIMADYDEEDLMECNPWDSMYLIRQLRFYIAHGTNMIAAEKEDILFDQGKVLLRDDLGRSVYVPCTIHGEVGNE